MNSDEAYPNSSETKPRIHPPSTKKKNITHSPASTTTTTIVHLRHPGKCFGLGFNFSTQEWIKLIITTIPYLNQWWWIKSWQLKQWRRKAVAAPMHEENYLIDGEGGKERWKMKERSNIWRREKERRKDKIWIRTGEEVFEEKKRRMKSDRGVETLKRFLMHLWSQ